MLNGISDELFLAAPLLVTALGSLVVLLLGVFIKGRWPVAGVCTAIVLLAFAFLSLQATELGEGLVLFNNAIYADHFTAFITALILLGTLLAIWLAADNLVNQGVKEHHPEFYTLILMCSSGAIIFASAAELITLFIGLEIMSMGLYCLCASRLGGSASSESALKYFFLGSFASAFMLYGIALLYGLSGSLVISEIAPALAAANGTLLYIAMGLVLIGFIFKIGAVPFHFWAPDVYQGAPTPVTAYMACVVKTAAVAAALRVLWGVFYAPELQELWQGMLWFVALLTMIVGNFLALRQRSLKRMLAYSSIAHAGYLLVAFLVPEARFGGGAAILYYLLAYTVMTLGAFGVVMAVTRRNATEDDADDITAFNRLGFSNPGLAALMALFMLSLAGLPPGMAGLLAKFYVFNAAVKGGFVLLAIIGVLCSVVSCYYYLRVVVAMYFLPEEEGSAAAEKLETPFLMNWSLRICAISVLIIGIFPSKFYEAAAFAISQF